MNRPRMAPVAVIALSAPLLAIGCGSSPSTGTSPSTGAGKAAAAPCPEIDGAVSQAVTVRNRLDVPITLSASPTCDAESSRTRRPVFSGADNPGQLDGVRLEPGGGPVTVTLAGPPVASGGITCRASCFTVRFAGSDVNDAYSLQMKFGATNGTGTLQGYDWLSTDAAGRPVYSEGACLDAFATAAGPRAGVFNVSANTLTFAPRVESDC